MPQSDFQTLKKRTVVSLTLVLFEEVRDALRILKKKKTGGTYRGIPAELRKTRSVGIATKQIGPNVSCRTCEHIFEENKR